MLGVADIAQQLRIAPASVTSMVQKMAKAGLLNYERYRGLTLTPTGEAAAPSNLAIATGC